VRRILKAIQACRMPPSKTIVFPRVRGQAPESERRGTEPTVPPLNRARCCAMRKVAANTRTTGGLTPRGSASWCRAARLPFQGSGTPAPRLAGGTVPAHSSTTRAVHVCFTWPTAVVRTVFFSGDTSRRTPSRAIEISVLPVGSRTKPEGQVPRLRSAGLSPRALLPLVTDPSGPPRPGVSGSRAGARRC